MEECGPTLASKYPQGWGARVKERSQKLIDKALDAIEVAEGVLDIGKPEFSAGRAYYAMFYIAEALLYEKGWNFIHMDRLLERMEKLLPKQKNSTPNFIGI